MKEDSDAESEEEVELQLDFDENGRVGKWTGNVDFGFRTFVNAVQTTSKPLVFLFSLLILLPSLLYSLVPSLLLIIFYFFDLRKVIADCQSAFTARSTGKR